MSDSNILSAAIDAFKQTFTKMCSDLPNTLDTLDEKSFKMMTEVLLNAAGNAGIAGLETFLAESDTVHATITKNGSVYRYKGKCSKELLTLFGTINVERTMYYDEVNGGQYYYPIDAALGLEKDDFATLETREMLLFAASSSVPSEVEQLLKKCSLCQPSRTAIQNIINRDGQLMESLRDKIAQNVFDHYQPPKETKALVASLDGVNVLLREKGKKKGRKNKRPQDSIQTDLASTSYHNAMVGSVSLYGVDAQGKPERLSSVYTARMPEEKSIEFKKEFERMVKTVESKFSGDTSPVYRVLLTDGHLMIKGYAKESAFLQQYEKCLDFYHATEHLSKAADAMYGEKTDFSKAYYAKWRSRLLSVSNAPDAIVRSLVSFQQRTPLTGKRKDELKTEVTFFKKNKKLMKYYNFNKRGLPIGSGPIEAAAKTIVRQRMCRSGMSWSRVKGQYVLTVRSYVKSGLWDEAWEYYVELKKAA